MNIEIQDFRNIEDDKKRMEIIYQALISLEAQLSVVPDGKLPMGTILPFAVTKEMMLPNGFEKCNGQNRTPDLQKSFTNEIIYIQRVK